MRVGGTTGARRFLVLVLAVVLVACGSSGGDSQTAEGKKFVAAIETKYRSGNNGQTFTKAQAHCLATRMVDTITVDKFKAAGVSTTEIVSDPNSFKTVGRRLDAQQAKDLANVLTGGGCFNFTDVVVKSAARSSNNFGGVSKTKVRCLFDKLLSNEAFKDAMVNSILGRETSGSAISNSLKNESQIFRYLADCKIKPSELQG
jgi:hypothetical protein